MPFLRFASPRAAGGTVRHRLSAAALIALPLLSGCRESLTQVDAGVVESGIWPTLRFEQSLPTLGGLAAAGPFGAAEQALVDRWESTWNHGATRGRELREGVYREARALPFTVDPAVARGATESVRAALGEARGFGGSLPPHLTRRIDVAGRLLAKAEAAGPEGDWTGAGLHALQSADILRETSPRSAALTLVEAAEAALGPPPSVDGGEPASLARARRLAWWGRVAIRGERYSLAIQRGYYACLLLGVRVS